MGRSDGNPNPNNISGQGQFQSPYAPGPVTQAPRAFDNSSSSDSDDEKKPKSYHNAPPEKPPKQAFPPQGTYPPHQTYPPPQVYPPPESEPVQFPPKQDAYQQSSVAQFPPAPGTNYSVPPANMNANMGTPATPMNHNVYMNNNIQPVLAVPSTFAVQAPINQWSSSLFDCMNEPENAIITACFPCVTFGQIAEILDHGQTTCGTSGMMYGLIAFCIAMPCLMSCGYRTKMRSQFGLIETPAPDWMVHCFCEWCALCQEYRELKTRGLDPALGWQGNAAKMNMMPTMTPPLQPMMGR